jgi:F-box/WD-40 domain protein 7
LALYVLSFLDPKDLLQAAQTCRYWRILCDDSLLWKEKCREAGIGPFSAMAQRVHNRRGRGNLRLGTLPGSRMCPGASDNNCISSCEPWKSAYLRQHNVEMNWRFQTIRPAKTLKGHDDHVITCLQFSANRYEKLYNPPCLLIFH